MDVMNLLSGGVVMGNVAQLQQSNTSVDNTVFQKQFFSLLNSSSTQTGAATEGNAAVVANILGNGQEKLGLESLSLEQLNEWLEKLISDLEELEELQLTETQVETLDALMHQIEALISVISFSNAESFSFAETAAFNEVDLLSSNHEAKGIIVKLQDQLLLLQQMVQAESTKVMQGKSSFDVVAEQLQLVGAKVTEILQDAKAKTSSQSLESSLHNSKFVAQDSGNASDSDTLLQRMNQESSYVQAAAKANEAANGIAASTPTFDEANTNVLQTSPITLLRADNVKELMPQLSKGSANLSNVYVMADEFADTMRGLIVNRFNVSALNGVSEARLSLTPEQLGHVDVKISMQNGILTAVFQTETAMAKDALENQMIQLRASLAGQGFTVEKIEVSQAATASGLDQQQREHSHQGHGKEGNTKRNFEETFEDELILNTTNQELGFGRAVNETV